MNSAASRTNRLAMLRSAASPASPAVDSAPPIGSAFALSHTHRATSSAISRPTGSSPCMFPMNPNRNRPSADPSPPSPPSPSASAPVAAAPTSSAPTIAVLSLPPRTCVPSSRAMTRLPRVVFPNTRVRASPRHVVRAISSTRCASASFEAYARTVPVVRCPPRASLALVDASSDDKRRAPPPRAGSASRAASIARVAHPRARVANTARMARAHGDGTPLATGHEP